MNKNMKIINYLIFIFLFSSCSSGWHLQRAKMHTLKAIAKGGEVKQDTVFKEILLKVPAVKVEFIPKPLVVNDTMYFQRDRVVTKVLVKNIPGKDKVVYVKTDCPETRIESKVPVSINQKITAKAGINWKTFIFWVLIALIIGIFIGRFLLDRIIKLLIRV